MPQWDASTYLKFANERTQPAIDLIHRIQIEAPHKIADLGCGPGNSTEALQRRWPEAKVTGFDSSPQMIDAARQACPAGQWELADVATWAAGEPFDIVFANAVLQWIPDHEGLCRRLFEQVAPSGVLAFQVPAPAHFETPVHRKIIEVSQDPLWKERLESARGIFTHPPAALYYDTLQAFASRIDMWETTYYHVMNGPEALLDWYRGTGLRPYLEALANEAEREKFEKRVLAYYAEHYPHQPNGKVLFPFPRLFVVAYK